ncbi:hypothetical protein KAS08_03130 [Candidatus Pacearchaeota archaeon]|nr:hypothetical protein [Candidatus Pacearchaeota archaeon]
MRGIGIVFCLIIFFMSFVASATEMTCAIFEDETFVTINSENDEVIMLPEKYSQLISHDDFEVRDNEILISNGIIKFTTKDYVKKVNDEQLFVLPKITKSNSDIKVILPQNYILSNNLVYPKNYELSTNGKNMILTWKNNSEEIIIFYKGTMDSNLLYYIIIIFSLTAAIFILFIQQKRFTEKLKEMKLRQKKKIEKIKETKVIQMTKNLFGDEKKIIEFLLTTENKSCWTKELVKVLGISKVKLSRKIRALIEKELIRKEKFGNENKITLN